MVFVSVVIPTKDREKYIERTIKSVLSQTISDLEIIIVDDGSTDNTEEIVESFQRSYPFIKYIKNEDSVGGAKARNQGADKAEGKYLAFLDSDDEWLPEHLKKGINLMETNHSKGVYGSFYVQTNEIRIANNQHNQKDFFSIGDIIFLGRGDTRTSTFIFNKISFDKVKFDENQHKHQDWDLAIRFEKKFKFDINKEKTVIIHNDVHNRMSSSMNHSATEYLLNKHRSIISKKALFHFYIRSANMTLKMEGKTKPFYNYYYSAKSLLTDNDSSYALLEVAKFQLLKLPLPVYQALYKMHRRIKK